MIIPNIWENKSHVPKHQPLLDFRWFPSAISIFTSLELVSSHRRFFFWAPQDLWSRDRHPNIEPINGLVYGKIYRKLSDFQLIYEAFQSGSMYIRICPNLTCFLFEIGDVSNHFKWTVVTNHNSSTIRWLGNSIRRSVASSPLFIGNLWYVSGIWIPQVRSFYYRSLH